MPQGTQKNKGTQKKGVPKKISASGYSKKIRVLKTNKGYSQKIVPQGTQNK